MGQVSGKYVAAALIPALIIVVLFFFDHNVSSQMAQLPEFNLKKPPAYYYDFALLACMVSSRLLCTLCRNTPLEEVICDLGNSSACSSRCMQSSVTQQQCCSCERPDMASPLLRDGFAKRRSASCSDGMIMHLCHDGCNLIRGGSGQYLISAAFAGPSVWTIPTQMSHHAAGSCIAQSFMSFNAVVQTLACGLLGIPPVNGVLPQAPMHTRSLITLRAQNTLAALRRKRKARLKPNTSGRRASLCTSREGHQAMSTRARSNTWLLFASVR